jgi:hypothetical protein
MRILLAFLLFCQTTFAQSPIVFRFDTTPTDKNPSISDFLQKLRDEEAKFPLKEQYNTQLMVTRLRKIFYGSPNYDKYLIKGVADIKPSYVIKDVIDPQFDKSIKTPIGWNVKIIDTVAIPNDSVNESSKPSPHPFLNHEIKLNERQVIDIGHTFCGIDAAFHPHPITPPKILGINVTRIKIDNNQSGITWVGDLGSAVAEVYFAQRKYKEKFSHEIKQKIIDNLSSPADNLGNIDCYILSKFFLEKNTTKVTDLLEKFYLSDELDCQQMRQNRYLYFAKSIGLDWNGTTFSNQPKMLKYYADQVNDAAAFHYAIGAKRGGKWNLVKALPSIFRLSRSKYSKNVVNAFFEALKIELTKNK